MTHDSKIINRKSLALLPVLAFAAVAVFLLREPLLMGKSILLVDLTRYAPWGDGKGEFRDNPAFHEQPFASFPRKALYRERIKSKVLPGWEHRLIMGYPVAGEAQYGWFDPFNLLFLAFPLEAAFKVLAFLQLFLMGLFSFLYLREVGCLKISAWSGGLFFMTSPFVITHLGFPSIVQTSLWLPFLLWIYERMSRLCRPWPYLGFISIGVAMTILGGEPSFYITILGAFCVYVIGRILLPGAWECLEPKPGRLIWFIAALILGIALTAPQLLPTLELGRYSDFHALADSIVARAHTGPLHAGSAAYSGVAMSLVFWVVRFRWRDRRVIMLAATGILSLTAVWVLFALRPSVIYLFGGFVALLAGIGLDDLYRDLTASRRRFAGFLAGFVLFIYLILVAGSMLVHRWADFVSSPYMLFMACLAFGAVCFIVIITRWRRNRWIPVGGLILLALIDAGILAGRYLKYQDRGYPESPPAALKWLGERSDGARLARFGGPSEVFPSSAPLIYGIEDAQGQPAFMPRRVAAYWSAIEPGSHSQGHILLREVDSLRSPLLDAAGVRYLLSDVPLPEEVENAGWEQAYDEGMWIYLNREAFGRAWVAPLARFVDDEQAAYMAISEDGFDPSREVVIEGEGTGFINGGKGSAEVKRLSQDELRVSVKAPEGGWLVLAETAFPGWTAQIGGRQVKLYNANVAFKAVCLNPGDSVVTFSYRSRYRMTGYYLATLAAYFLILGLSWPKRKQRT